jgi:MFS family permease
MGRMADSDTHQFRNDIVSDLGGMSLVTRQRGTLTAVALAMFCIQLDFFALTLALPDMARSFAVTAQSAQWTLSGYMLSLGSLFIVAGRIGDIVGRRRASGVVLTFLITTGGVGLAGAASIIGGLLRAGHDPASAYNTTLRAFALLALAASVAVLLIRHMLVRRGLMKPLSMAGDQAGGAAGAGRAVAHGWVSDLPECALFPACDLRHAQCAPGACSSAG